MEKFSLLPGFRFHPTDEELVAYYLRRKVTGRKIDGNAISDVDLYKVEPWDLPQMSRLQNRDLEWYFFSPRDRKYPTGSRTNRATELGYWKTTGKDRSVYSGSRNTGMKKTLVFYKGRAPRAERTDWVIHEYRLSDEECEKLQARQDEFVLCRLFKKSGPGPKIGEQYGAPLEDEEWEQFSIIESGGTHNFMRESMDLPQGNSDMQLQDGGGQKKISPQQVPNETAQFETDTPRKADSCLVNKVSAILNGPDTESSPENIMLPLPTMHERDWLTPMLERPDGWDIMEHILPLDGGSSDAMVSGKLEEDILKEMYQLVGGEGGGNRDDEHGAVNSFSDSFATCNDLLIPETLPDGDFIELDDLQLPMITLCDLNEQSLLDETNIRHQPGNLSVVDGTAFDSDACGIQDSLGWEDALGADFSDEAALFSFASNIETNMESGDFLQVSSGFANSEQNQELAVYRNNPNQVSSQGGAEPFAVSMQAASEYDDVVAVFEYLNAVENTGDSNLSSFPLLSEDFQGENRIEGFELNDEISRNVNNFEGGQELNMGFRGSTIVEQASQFNTGTQEFTAVASFEGSEKASKRLASRLLSILGSVPTLPASAAEISPRVGTISVMTSNMNVSAAGPNVCSCTKDKEEFCPRCSILKGEKHETLVQSLTYSNQKHVVETPNTGAFAMAFLIAIWACFWLLLGGATWKLFRGIFRLVIS